MRAIDADSFKDYIRGACEDMKHLYKDNGAWAKEITESFCKDIDEQPTIQPKRGKWVLVCDNNGMHFICNKCGAWRYHQEQKFCGECGADMRGEQDG